LQEAFKTAIIPDVGEIMVAFQQAQAPVLSLAKKLAGICDENICPGSAASC